MANLFGMNPYPGLLGQDDLNYARTQGLLGAASGLLGASGWSPTPVSMGQALGRGLQGGMTGYNQAANQLLQGRLAAAQLAPEASKVTIKDVRVGVDKSGRPLLRSGAFDAQGNVVNWLGDPTPTTPAASITNITGQQDPSSKPIPINELTKLVDEQGRTPSFATYGDLQTGRYKLTTAKARERVQKVRGALGILDTLEDMAIGREGIFQNFRPGVKNRLGDAFEAWGQQLSQEDPRFAEYSGVAVGSLAPLIKALGESGNLAQGDVGRALQSIPKLPGMEGVVLPDTYDVAKGKFEKLRRILGNVSEEALSEAQARVAAPQEAPLTPAEIQELNELRQRYGR